MNGKEVNILVVDDMEINRALLSAIFNSEYNVLEACNGQEALDIIEDPNQRIDIILLDIMMPVIDGFGVLKRMKELNLMAHVPVVFITADNSLGYMKKGYSLGVIDYITKPFDADIVRQRVKNVMVIYRRQDELEKMVSLQTQRLRKQSLLLVDALSSIIEFKSADSGKHILRMRLITRFLLERFSAAGLIEEDLTPERIELISEAAIMHDVGKIAISDDILNKPGRLTDEEFDIMKTHTTQGCKVLEKLKGIRSEEYMNYCHDICLHHHERWDGSGYPEHLKGDEISVWAQAVAFADVYDALTNERVYKKAFSHEKTIEMIGAGECGVFNPILLKCFVENSDDMRNYVANAIENLS